MARLNAGFSISQSRLFLHVLLIFSFASGCAALIYEVVWFQMLQLVIGSSAVSLGVLLGTYMGGMCLGSLMLSRLLPPLWNPLRVCASLEAGIGLMGVLILLVLPEAAIICSRQTGSGSTGILLRGFFTAGYLMPPTVFMGATLPAMVRWVQTTRPGVSWLGSFYGCNLAGAVAGCLLAGFYLLRVYDTSVATYVAAGINGMIALAALVLSFLKRPEPTMQSKPAPATNRRAPVTRPAPSKSAVSVYVTIALSGMTALGAEVIWTRLLSLILGGTVYAFSIILAVFLIGIGIGSHFGAMIVRRSRSPEFALGWCQFLLTGAIAWSAYMLMNSLPYWPPPTVSTQPWINFQMSLSDCLWAVLPPTVLWGASFPLALAAVAAPGQDAARLFGNISAANMLGGIIGGVGFSIVLIPLQGTQYGQRLLIVLATFAAILMLTPWVWKRRRESSLAFTCRCALAALGFITLPVFGVWSVSKVPGELLAFGRNVQWMGDRSELLFAGEGENYPVGVSQVWNTHVRLFHVSGKIEASTYVQDMRLQRMLGHLPALLHPDPESVLVVGCGAGVTAGSFTLHPSVKKIVICEIEPLVPKIAAEYFSRENYGVLKDFRTQLVLDDARHYVLTTTNMFDIITSDPIHPWIKGSADLYTKEFFELLKAHLNRGGIVTQWVPLYQSDLTVVKSELATFFETFPNGTLWSSDRPGLGSDIVMLGQYGGSQINLDEMQRRLKETGYRRVAESLQEIGFASSLDLLAGYSGRACDLAPWLQDAQINRDRNLRLEYLAGFTLNQQAGNSIYRDLLAYRKFPPELFVGSLQLTAALKARLSGQ
ncbi:MAG TPA: fused MFS/spermidine synthase [Candidatus Acidoferrales bacterium]|nr:fused MFS/spermidine synthase [Candidatus Acidoferrales bacterium]